MKEKIKILKIIHLAICVGVIFVYVFLGKLKSIENIEIPSINSHSAIYLLIPIIGFLASNFIFKKLLQTLKRKSAIAEKYILYLAASIARWAILEATCFLILFIKKDFIVFGIVIIVYLIILRPSEDRIKADLDLVH